MPQDTEDRLYNILQQNSQFPLAAYRALHYGLEYTVRLKGIQGHISGQELAIGMAAYLKTEYGPFTWMVLKGWNIQSTLDFGRIVYNLIDVGLMRKQDNDSIDDFLDVYDFKDIFGGPTDWLLDLRSEFGLAPRNA